MDRAYLLLKVLFISILFSSIRMICVLKTFILILYSITFVAADVGQKCTNNNDSDSTCVLVTDCEAALSSIRKYGCHYFKRCGFYDKTEIVCCPESKIKFGNEKPNKNNNVNSPSSRGTRIADRECENLVKSITPPLGLYILGGEEASLGEFPHMVGLGFDKELGAGLEFDCGGSLLSHDYVLTAAHCVDTLDRIEPTVVRVGVIEIGGNRFNEETDYRISQIIRHPDYTRKEKYHDLALLRLESPVEYTSNVNPVCLYTSGRDPQIELTITGWGLTSNKRNIKSNILLKANVTVTAINKCTQSYQNWRKLPRGITNEQICAGDSDGVKDTCQGDSGGPLQGLTASDGRYRLIGITSFGRGCGSGYPGIYTRVYNYIDWIENIVWPGIDVHT